MLPMRLGSLQVSGMPPMNGHSCNRVMSCIVATTDTASPSSR